jgi:hypothetical protein
MQKKPYLAAAAATLLSLGACNSNPEAEVVNQYDAQAAALRNAAPVVLPPAILASRAYRCSDNSLYYVDFYNNNTALIRTTQEGMPTSLTSADGTAPYTGEGYTVSANANNVRINNLSCHV